MKLLLEIGNSVCRIRGLSLKQEKQLSDILSYELPHNTFSGGHRPTKQRLMGKRGDFPTGLLPYVQVFLAKERLKATVQDARKRPQPDASSFNLQLSFTPYPEQIEAAKAVKHYDRGIVVAPTGLGKSVIAALIIDQLKVRTLIVVPTLELKRQLTGSLRGSFPGCAVGGLATKGVHIAVENVDALDPKKPLLGFDCVIVDEFHHSGAKTYRNLNKKAWGGVFHKIGLTATPFRSQDHERLLLESVLSQVVYRVGYVTAVEKGYIAPLEAYYYDLPPVAVEADTWKGVYSEIVVRNSARNALIAGILDRLQAAELSALCLVKEIEHGLQIQEAAECFHDFVKGENDDNREKILEFLLREKKTIIGTTGVIGEGVDTKPAEYVIIAGLGKSKNAFMQQVGRCFRVYPGKESGKVIIFRDASHKWSLAHFKAQVKILTEEYGVTPIKLMESAD